VGMGATGVCEELRVDGGAESNARHAINVASICHDVERPSPGLEP
jgi:hypothetical protein